MVVNIWSDICDLFFPRYCVVCGRRLVRDEECICITCLAGLPRTMMHGKKDNEMEKSFWGRFPVERANAFLYYAKGGDVRKLLYELKYYGNWKIGVFMGKCMATELSSSSFFEGIDAIVPIPLHPEKICKRGYNQSEMLAKGISMVTGIPMWKDMLVRSQFTETQTHKSQYERWMNVNGVFVCKRPQELGGKHILLVDDVFTTGATLIACADALTEICDLKISVLTLAMAGES